MQLKPNKIATTVRKVNFKDTCFLISRIFKTCSQLKRKRFVRLDSFDGGATNLQLQGKTTGRASIVLTSYFEVVLFKITDTNELFLIPTSDIAGEVTVANCIFAAQWTKNKTAPYSRQNNKYADPLCFQQRIKCMS